MSRILIVDDEVSICWAFRESLTDEGYEVETASSAEEGLGLALHHRFDVVVLDIRLPGIDGLTAIREFRARIGDAPIIIITAFGNLETVVRAMEAGAFDYLVKPFDLDQATQVVKRAIEQQPCDPPKANSTGEAAETLIGRSPAMQELFKRIALVARADVPVLITGESGTGKELIARAIHRHGSRRDQPFLPVCLAALSPGLVESELFGHVKGAFTGAIHDRKGLLELANGGTVLLDEIGDISLPLQVKLLRAIEQREITPVGDVRCRSINIRIIAATNRPLAQLMKSGEFREDLYFRLSVFHIESPPLRDRLEDVPDLAAHFLQQCHWANQQPGVLTAEALSELVARSWPGNVRELRNTIEHAAVVSRGQPIRPEHLPPRVTGDVPRTRSLTEAVSEDLSAWSERAAGLMEAVPIYDRFLELTEPPLLRTVLRHHQGNRAAAAQALGIHRATLRQKLRKYGIE